MDRVTVFRPMIGIFAMQVCAVKDATNKEILLHCNLHNPSGTSNGWSRVVRNEGDKSTLMSDNQLPVQCAEHEDRLHFLVFC